MSRTSKTSIVCPGNEHPLLAENEQTLLYDCTSELISFHNKKLEIVWANRAASQSSGLLPEQLTGRRCYEVWYQRTEPCPHCPAQKVFQTGASVRCEQTTPDGRTWDMQVRPVETVHGDAVSVIVAKRDITEHKRIQQTLERIKRALAVISQSNGVLVKATDEQTLLRETCRILVDIGGYALAWVAYTDCGPHQRIIPVCYAGNGQKYIAAIERKLAQSDELLSRMAIKQRKTCVARNVRAVASHSRWARLALEHDFSSAVALPFLNNGSAFGALCICAATTDMFTERELMMLRELTDDIVYGITTLRTRIEHRRSKLRVQHSLVRLQNALEETVQALSSVVEKRDCYTAGHQRRVTRLACAIAHKIGMPPEQIQGVRLAGLLHDIGKIVIPSEILTKPATLSNAESAIVRTHPHVGYDIVKSIDFPWPVAQIILQHHERMDTSGYPQKLRGSQILIEARIIAVADVVEAMSSHRPYRAARTVDVAMQEIATNRERCYDPKVVDACLRIMQHGEFQFETMT
jgi:putative nucleotidyltransferase with HDIG domain/PAS domain S-box-containing protein